MLTTVTYPHSVYQDYCTDWSIIRKCLHPTEVLHILSTQSTHKYLNIDAFIVFFFLLLTQGKAMKVISQWEQMNCLDVWDFLFISLLTAETATQVCVRRCLDAGNEEPGGARDNLDIFFH